jgi:hypothetical protein
MARLILYGFIQGIHHNPPQPLRAIGHFPDFGIVGLGQIKRDWFTCQIISLLTELSRLISRHILKYSVFIVDNTKYIWLNINCRGYATKQPHLSIIATGS